MKDVATPGDQSTVKAGKAGNRVKAGKGLKSFKTKSMSKFSKMAGLFGKMAPMLGLMGFVVPFILAFFGQSDPTLKIMTDNFFQINEKLDHIESQLDEMKVLITSASQKAAYIETESTIKHGYRQMNVMFKEWKGVEKNCTTKKQCLRDKIKIAETYAKKMEGTETALNTLLTGLAAPGSEFSKSIMSLIQKDTNCDVPQMMNVYEKMFSLARKAQNVVVVLKKLRESKTSMLESNNHWLQNMYEFRDRMYETTNYCFTNLRYYVQKDLEKMTGQDVSYIQTQLNRKYDWVKWVSGIYIRVSM